MAFADHFSGHAGSYSQFRPRYPRELYEFLASLPPRRDRAWDCATGNGQAAVDLAEWFAHVVATDPSENQLAHAERRDNVEYLVATAEHPPIESDSIDLVTVAQALHWFDRPVFYEQVRRVSRAGAVIAAWFYGLANVTAEIDEVVWRLYEDILGPYWPTERHLVEERYESVEFPFVQLEAPPFAMSAHWSLDAMLGYLGTWSSAQRYAKQHGVDPITLVRADLERVWGEPGEVHRVHWPLYLRVGRVE